MCLGKNNVLKYISGSINLTDKENEIMNLLILELLMSTDYYLSFSNSNWWTSYFSIIIDMNSVELTFI